ncbi:MAG: type 1 glutamine amidotransferase [Candidatus Magasanikbacteria bacterium]|mgnify:CR=1 FL=1|jgi:GMP synthase-like glutamine amidotransferase|nr:type 1 glutamine amidotransferase [Candidatus Magasanikbacteria bacterium]MBT4072034.1 type 1 glutamine amidotransferase [Candidatus Magasanikbacteria bacterium]
MKKILVIQFRQGAEVEQEQNCFLAEMPEYKDQIIFVNVIEESVPTDVSDVAGLIIAGSSQYYLSKEETLGPWKEDVFALLDKVIEMDIPVLGACFGFQMIALQQGAGIERNPETKQTGTLMVTRFETGKDDELMGYLPEEHAGLFAHQDTVIELPEHIIPLCRTERVECTSFRIFGKRVWGTLFHPELTGERVIERLNLIPTEGGSGYRGEKSDEELLEIFSPTPEVATILGRFADIALGE